MQAAFQARLGVPALLLGATGIGFAPILVRWSEVGPSATAAYRVLLALPLLWLLVGWERKRRPSAPRPIQFKHGLLLMAAGVFFAADLGLWHWSLQFTSVANSTVLINLTPIGVTLGAWLIFDERITRAFLLGLVTALVGAGLLVATSLQLNFAHWRGDLLAVATTLFYAGYLLTVKGLRGSLSTVVVMAWSGLAMVPAALFFALLSGEQLWPGTWRGWQVLLGLALVSHVGGQVLIAYGLGHLPASFSALSLLWQPVVAALAAWLFLAEKLTLLQCIGGLAVLFGIATATQTLNTRKSIAQVKVPENSPGAE